MTMEGEVNLISPSTGSFGRLWVNFQFWVNYHCALIKICSVVHLCHLKEQYGVCCRPLVVKSK